MKENTHKFTFTREFLWDALKIWEQSVITLIDIRYRLIFREEPMEQYITPGNVFIYTSGKAEVRLGDNLYRTEPFGIFHGGKGTELSIQPLDTWLDTYMILYKAAEPPVAKREYIRRLEKNNPFLQQYGFQTMNPIFYGELLQAMLERWNRATPLYRFYGKTGFYQLVYEIYAELEKGRIEVLTPDIIAMTKKYIDKHYQASITISSVAHVLGISDSHLRRSFKANYGISPQEYLIETRLMQAKKLLSDKKVPIRAVALATGFTDEFSFSKLFSKKVGLTPSEFRAKTTTSLSDNTMDLRCQVTYNKEEFVRLSKLNPEGAFQMIKNIRNKTAIAGVLAFMLLLTACAPNISVVNETKETPVPTVASEASGAGTTEVTNIETKIVTTVKGEVEVPVRPERVVVLNYGFGDILALGVTPVAVNDYWAIAGAPFEDLLKDVPRVNGPEAIMDVKPDLIITSYEDESEYDKLSKIAPTVSLGSAKDTATKTTEERFKYLGELLGIEEVKIQDTLDTYHEYIEQSKKKLTAAGIVGKSVTIISGTPDAAGIVVSTYKGAHTLYNELGMLRNEKAQEILDDGEWYADLSLEVLPEYCGDYIIIYGDKNEYEGIAVYDNIKAVKEGQVILANEYLMNFDDVISVQAQIDYLVEQLIAHTTK